MKKIVYLSLLLLGLFCSKGHTAIIDDFTQLQQELNTALLDVCAGKVSAPMREGLNQSIQAVNTQLDPAVAHTLKLASFNIGTNEDFAATVGRTRSQMQHVAALEMLENQRQGRVAQAQMWRDLITFPQFADADVGALLLQETPDDVRKPEVTRALAREYITWQVARTRQLLDRFQRAAAEGGANEPFVRAYLAETQALARFPQPLLQAAGLAGSTPEDLPRPNMTSPYQSTASLDSLSAWREQLEATLPNLLTDADVTRYGRLLARFVDLVPKEYRNGVREGKVLIPLELREANTFLQQAQQLANELAPTWRRDRRGTYDRCHLDLVHKFNGLQVQIKQLDDPDKIEASAQDIGNLLESQFGLSAKRVGDKGKIIEETALEVRAALNGSLAAARADQWQQAEAMRLDAYTAFDSEIEIRVLPRNPTVARRAERSFIDGQSDEPGIKALLDQRAPIEELTAGYERTLKNLDDCATMLKVSVSPATIGFTAFTIIAREGLEAIVILAALLAGLRGDENRSTRQWVLSGAALAGVATLITFWLSQTIVQSLIRFGEKLEAVVSVFAVLILLLVTNWVFHKFYWVEWNARLRKLSNAAQEVTRRRWEMIALLGVGFATVYREGFETTIFMQSLLLEGGKVAVISGVSAGFFFVLTAGALIFLFGVRLPYRKLLIFTGLLVVSIMVTFLGSTVRLFQTVGWLHVHPIAWLPLPYWTGLWLGLYPSWEGILIPPMALVYVGGAWLYQKIVSRSEMAAKEAARAAEAIAESLPRRNNIYYYEKTQTQINPHRN